jgi:signal transduction histidine kinase
LSFIEAQRRRKNFETFHGTLDTRRFHDHYWVYLRWAPTRGPLLLQFRHGDNTPVALFYPDSSNHCPAGNLARLRTNENSMSGWANVPLCAGATEAYLRVAKPTGYPRVAFRVTHYEKAAALDFIETAAPFATGGLGIIASLLALFRLAKRKSDVLAIGLLVQQVTRVPYWTATLNPPHYTNVGKLKLFTDTLPLESWRVLLVLGVLVYLQALVQRTTRRTPWHHALTALTVTGAVAYFSALLGAMPDYTMVVWGLLIAALPVSMIAALQSVSSTTQLPLGAIGEQPLYQANWSLAGIAALAWIGTVLPLNEVTPDVAMLAAIPFYLVVAASVIIEAADESRRAFADALQQRLAREIAEREATLQSQQYAETRDLLLMLTHELRTPLGVLRFSLDAARTMPAARARAEEAIRNMDSLVERCLQAAHLEADSVAETPDRWNPALEIPLLVQQCRAPERVQLDIDVDSPATMTRRRVFGLIISVVLDNALKYGMAAGTVKLRVQPEVFNGQLGLALLVDNLPGPSGLPDPRRLFQKYYRSPGAHQHSGAGLGLYLSKRLMDRLNGHVAYLSLPNNTRFTLWIPC